MPYYYRSSSHEVREMDAAFFAAWVAAGNPKAAEWAVIPDPPSSDARWDGQQWVLPAPYVPQSITRFQGKAVLTQRGLLGQVEAAVAASPDPYVALAWAECLTFERNSAMVLGITQQLGLTPAEVDQMFRDGAAIQ